jgi:hypothetical protein
LDFYTTVFEVIDMRSFSNLWYWIALAVLWSTTSHWVLGVPYDLVQRARREGGETEEDVLSMLRGSCNRLAHIGEVLGFWVLAGDARGARRQGGWRRWPRRLRRLLRAMATSRCCAFRAGIACPMTGSRPMPIFRPRAWPRWPRWCMGPGRFVLLTTLNAATQRLPAREVLREGGVHARGRTPDRRGRRCGVSSCAWGFPRAPR